MLSEYNYCFMQAALVDANEKIKAFRVICGDTEFQKFAYYTIDLNGLKHLCEMKDLIKDFDLEGTFLRCDNIPKVIFTTEDLYVLNKIIPLESSNLLQDFLLWGAKNDCLILNDEEGTQFAKFIDIQVAQKTMSIYVKMVADADIHNKMLVYMKDTELVCNDFLVAVPSGCKLPMQFKYTKCEALQDKRTIFNRSYDVYNVNISDMAYIDLLRANAFINKATTLSVKYRSMIDVLKEFKDTLCISQGFQVNDMKYNWVGGTNSYKDSFGVFFESSLKPISKNQKFEIINWFTELISECHNKDEIALRISEENNDLARLILNILLELMYSDLSTTDVIHNCIEMLNNCKLQLLSVDLFLYKLRAGAYINSIAIAPSYNPILVGSDEKNYTMVNSVFKTPV